MGIQLKMDVALCSRCIVVANHLPLKLVGATDDSYDFEWDDDALIGHIQARL